MDKYVIKQAEITSLPKIAKDSSFNTVDHYDNTKESCYSIVEMKKVKNQFKIICQKGDFNYEIEFGKNIEAFDIDVLEAVLTLVRRIIDNPANPVFNFTAKDLLRVIANDNGRHANPAEIKRIEESLLKMAYTTISITRYTVKKKTTEDDEITITKKITDCTYLLPLGVRTESVETVSKEGTKITNVRIWDLKYYPEIFDYADQQKHIYKVESKYYDCLEAYNTKDLCMLKDYLAYEISEMVKPGGYRNKGKSSEVENRIIYERYRMVGKIRIREGLYEACGWNSTDYSRTVWNAKKPKIHKNVCKILDAYCKANIIKGYVEVKDEDGKIRGVDIIKISE